MLTGNLVRVRYSRDRIIPQYVDVDDEGTLQAAGHLLELFQQMQGHTRGELDELMEESFGDQGNLVHLGLARILEDRCEFEVVSGKPPEEIRAAVFRLATSRRSDSSVEESTLGNFDRDAILAQVAADMGITPAEVDQGLFADLKSEQRLLSIDLIEPRQLLQRYNVALAQAVLLRAVRVEVNILGEPPARYRQLMRQVKFRRLICEVERNAPDGYLLRLDGPLSLFSSTNRYGLNLALFLPALLLCRRFELAADLRWGPGRKPKKFLLGDRDGLVSHLTDQGMFQPPEIKLFADNFRKRAKDWEIHDESEVFPLGTGFWVPDFRLVQISSGKVVHLEILGFWRKASAIKHLQKLQRHLHQPFVLAVSDDLHIEESADELPAGLHRFRHMPLVDEVVRLAKEQVRRSGAS